MKTSGEWGGGGRRGAKGCLRDSSFSSISPLALSVTVAPCRSSHDGVGEIGGEKAETFHAAAGVVVSSQFVLVSFLVSSQLTSTTLWSQLTCTTC